MHKQKLQLSQQQVAAGVTGPAGQQTGAQVQPAQTNAQANAQLAAVGAARPGAVLTGATVANLQVARLVRTSSGPPGRSLPN